MYQVLARKYRPRNFIELVGQNHVSRALTSALERGRLHHAYLFTGTRGVGKTTIARILAKCLNCETGVTSTPCEVCATCTAVNEGRFIDLIEIDAASRTKVEDTRELLDNVPYAPTQGRFKVYLIDEVHMLSTHSFNALLKTLEEPPEHVKFLFATTDPQKLPITVISRCLQFTLRPLAVDEITSHLSNILAQEQITAEQDAIWQIAESAQGSLRDALSLTDQAIAYGQGSIQHQDVKEMLGLIDRTIIFDLILAIHQNQQQQVSSLLMQFRQQALDVSLVLDQLISTLHELALLQYLPNLSLKYSAEINQKIMQLSGVISAQDIQLYYQVACKGRADLQLAVTQEQGFEMCVLRLLAFRPLQANEMLVKQPTAVQATQIFHNQIQQGASQPQTQASEAETSQQQKLSQDKNSNIIQAAAQASDQHPHQVDKQTSQDTVAQDALKKDALVRNEVEEVFAGASHQQAIHEQTMHQPTMHEPSSDDDLDEEIEAITHVEHVADPAMVSPELELNTSVVVEPIVENETIASEQQAEPALTLFGEAPLSAVAVQSTAQAEEIFFLNPTQETPSAQLENELATLNVEENSLDRSAKIDLETPLTESPSQHQPDRIEPVPVVTTDHNANTLMPQDILKLSPQHLDGEWTVDKWEYWFRNSELSPAVQELAQQGVMTGSIDGAGIFHIPQKYESLLTQFQATLESELKRQWSNSRFSVQYQDVIGATPYDQQVQRKQRAYQQASNLLHTENVVKGLIESFDGQLHNIQLKP